MGGHPYSSVLRLCTHLALMEVSNGCFADLNRPRVHQSTKLPPRRILPNMSVRRSHSFAVASRNLEFARLTVRLPLGLVGWQLVVHCRVHVLPSVRHHRHRSRYPYAPPLRCRPLIVHNRSNRRPRVLAPPYRRRVFVPPRRGWSLSSARRRLCVCPPTEAPSCPWLIISRPTR